MIQQGRVQQETIELETLSECLLCDGTSFQVLDKECNLNRCQNCGYIFDNPRPVLAELVKFYSRLSKYDAWLNELDERDSMWKRRLNLIAPFRKKGSLLDIGTGIGQFLAVARPYYDEVYGTEVSASAVQIAKEKYGLEVFRGTAEQLLPSGKTFDNISLIHVLEHVPDPAATIGVCHSLLSDGGMLAIAVPNDVSCLRHSLRKKLVAAGIRKPYPGTGKFCIHPIRLTEDTGEVHLSHFTPRVLENLLESSGFEVIKNVPDPHYVERRIDRKLRKDIFYQFCMGINKIAGANVFDTMLVIAKKKSVAETKSLLPEQRIAA